MIDSNLKIGYNEDGDGMNGVFIIDKPKGITSRDVVNKISKVIGTKKVGHTGTLDPLATGVLVVCVGVATKLVDELTSMDKEYIATVTLGIKTDTLDIEGKVEEDISSIKTKDEIVKCLNSFKGIYSQEVPKYSAIKVNGRKLYEYAREGIDIELPKRDVNIKEIELMNDIIYDNNKTIFSFRCCVSKGTYIRSLIRDIATSLNTCGIMTDLRRTRQGNFKIEDSISLDDVNVNNLIDIKDVLDIDKIELTSDIEKKVLNGCPLNNIYGKDKILFILNGTPVGIYKLDYDSNLLKPYKMLRGGNL